MLTNETIAQFCYYIAIIATILFVLKTIVFSILGGDAEVLSDFNTEFEFETSFDFLSIQSILAFFMGFGWIGLAGITQWNLKLAYAMTVAVVFGLILMYGTAYLMFLVKKLNKRVVNNYTACIGKIAKAYTSFHPASQGQIEVEVNGRLSIEKAVNSTQEEIEAFSQVKIIDYKENVFQIEKSNI